MRRKRALAGGITAGLIALAAGGLSVAQAQAPTRAIAFDRPETQVQTQVKGPAASGAPALELTSPAFHADGPIPQTYAFYGKNISPALAWTGAPPSTKAFVLIVEDPDAPSPAPSLAPSPAKSSAKSPAPLVHWLAYDIPPTVTAMNRGIRNTAEPTSPLGMLQGWNYHGSVGYTGPRPPPGDPVHHYHFQLFALDQRLRVRPGAQPAQVLRAMRGHVIARSDLVGLYAEPTPKVDAPAPPPGAPDG